MTWDGGKNGVARFELTPEGARTRLVLTHTGIGDSGHRKGTAAGWRSHLAVLAGRLSGHPVRDFWKPHAESMKRSEEHTSDLQSLMRISYAVFCLKKKNRQ